MARIGDLLASKRTISFEFFPPKTPLAHLNLGRAVGELALLRPDFVSITYGAGGSDRHRTGDIVGWMRAETDLEPMAHLTCQGHTRDEVAALLVDHRRRGVENILALGGDPPLDGTPARSDYRHALDLVREVAATGSFSIGVAAHPEIHPRSASREADRRHLAEKLELADFAITQFFFDAAHYLRLVDELAALGVDKPIVPGVMPFVGAAALRRMAAMNGTELPVWLTDRLDATDDPAEVRRLGVEAATRLSAELLDAGVPGLHLYALNRADTVKEVCANLGLAPA